MSRWANNFLKHQFHAQWARVLKINEQINAEDAWVQPHLEELSRLRKVIAYIDRAVQSVDPELLPYNFWDSVRDYMSSCADQLGSFRDNQSLEGLQAANNSLDAILAQLRPYLLAKGKLGPALQSAAMAYSEALTEAASGLGKKTDEALTELSKAQRRSAGLLEKIEREAREVGEKYDRFVVGNDEDEPVFDVLERNIEEIGSFHRRLAVGADESPSIREEIAIAKDASTSAKDAIDKLRSNATSTIQALADFETRILGVVDADGKRQGGLSAELDARMKALGDVEVQQKKRYAALNDQIETLLPSATSAGLASAYKQMKDSFANPIKHANRVFYFSIGAIVLLSIVVSVEELSASSIKFVQLTDWASMGRSLAHKLPFYAPLVWLAYYASKRRSEFQRLEQEYAHKEALAKSYDSYKKQIEELGAENGPLMRDLLAKAVDAIAFNASTSLDGRHGDKIPLQEAIEKAVLVATKQKVGQ